MHFEDSVLIDRPIDEVWAWQTDFFNNPRLFGRGLLGIRQTSPGSPGVGSTLQGRLVILGFETRVNLVITEWDPPHVLALSGALPFGPIVARYTFETVGNGTKMVRSRDVEPQGPLKLLSPLLVPYARRRMRAATRDMKQFIEGRPR